MKKITLLAVTLMPLWANAQVQLYIGQGAHMVASGAPYLVVNSGDWYNDGAFIPDQSVVVLTSDPNLPHNAHIGGDQATHFNSLVLQQSAGTVAELDQDVYIQQQVAMISGNLDLRDSRLHLSSDAVVAHESPDNYITSSGNGEIVQQTTLHYPQHANPGNLGLHITADAPLGSVVIRRGHRPTTYDGLQSIERYYALASPGYHGALNAQVQIQYFPHELNGHQPSSLQVWNSADGTTWAAHTPDQNDQTLHAVSISGLHHLSGLTLGAGLPVIPQSPSGTGTASGTFNLQFDVFPNPAVEGIHIRLPAIQADIQTKLLVLDHLGRVVLTAALPTDGTAQQCYVPLPVLPAGQYFVQVASRFNSFELKPLIIANRK
jgi:hypothetical protein